MKDKTTFIKKGTCVLIEKPFVYALQSKYRKERCDQCLKATNLMKCAGCDYVYYCNRTCQVDAWLFHKVECKYLKNINSRIIPDAARMLIRIILKIKYFGDMEKSYYSENAYRKFHDMMSHYDEILVDPKRISFFETLSIVLHSILGEEVLPNRTELLKLYGRLIINGFSILNSDMNSVGTGLYLAVSITNHSCSPNAVITFENTTLKMHVTEDMECLDWSKIFIAYIDLIEFKEERRKSLKDQYYFECNCTKCIDPGEPSELKGAACPNKNCKEFLNIEDSECKNCNTKITNAFRNEYKDIILYTKEHLIKMKEKEKAYLDVCRFYLKKQKLFLHPLNLIHIKTLDCAFEAAMDISNWEDALKYAPGLIAGYKKYGGHINNPILGLIHLKTGKIHALLGNKNEAKNSFNEARKIIEITHGRDSYLYKEQLVPLMQSCELIQI